MLHLSRAEISYFIHFNNLILENFEEKSEVIFDQLNVNKNHQKLSKKSKNNSAPQRVVKRIENLLIQRLDPLHFC